MRVESWWWLGWFCLVSLCLHLLVGRLSPSLSVGPLPAGSREIEIALQPPPEETEQKPDTKPEPKPEKKPAPRLEARRQPQPDPVKEKAEPKEPPAGPKDAPKPLVKSDEPRPEAPRENPGGLDPEKPRTPLRLGSPAAPRPVQSAARLESPESAPTPVPTLDTAPANPAIKSGAPGVRIGLNRPILDSSNPLAGAEGRPDERPGFGGPAGSAPNAGGPRLSRNVVAPPSPAGGGSPAPGPTPGIDGARGPERAPEEILFAGGGAGGNRLPTAAPRIGGGGGKTLFSVNNPLARDAVPEDRPGLGPGTGGGAGTGTGGGVGFSRGPGIGTRPDGRLALAAERAKPGAGIGAGTGNGIGTSAPGGGRGTGSELPGTGGSGTGYGKGTGLGVGNGRGAGFAVGAPGGSGRGGGPGTGGGGGGRLALNRGIPFGDIIGLLNGDGRGGGGRGGGPGGPGRGALFGQQPGLGGKDSGSDAPAHIIYVLDTSGSMNQGNKIGKAKDALKKALLELKPTDSFNIIHFAGNVDWFAASLLSATPANVKLGLEYVEAIQLRGGTNLSAGLEKALADPKATHIFLLSDGEPSRGITDPAQLRAAVKEWNRHRAQILTLALGLGEQFPGIPLLKGLAEDHGGKFSYVNLAK